MSGTDRTNFGSVMLLSGVVIMLSRIKIIFCVMCTLYSCLHKTEYYIMENALFENGVGFKIYKFVIGIK